MTVTFVSYKLVSWFNTGEFDNARIQTVFSWNFAGLINPKDASTVTENPAIARASVTRSPVTAEQSFEYLRKAMMDYKSGARSGTIMTDLMANRSDEEIALLARYYASQERY